MNQAELARDLDVSKQTVFAYELGDRRVSVLILPKLAKVFAVPVEDLMAFAKCNSWPFPGGHAPCRAIPAAEKN